VGGYSHLYWQTQLYADEEEWWPLLGDNKAEARMIVKFDGDWTDLTLSVLPSVTEESWADGIKVLELISDGWILAHISLFNDGVYLCHTDAWLYYKKICDIEDLSDGTWKEIRLTAEFSSSDVQSKAQWGPACGPLECDTFTSQHDHPEEDADYYQIYAMQHMWDHGVWGSTPVGPQSWSVAEWGILRQADAGPITC